MSEKALEQERINEEITASEVRLILEDGKQAGIVSIDEALKIAQERGYDLVEIAPNAKPPVCKLLDYGKFKFEKVKKEKEARKKQRQNMIETKELKLRPNIDEHDYDVKLKHIRRFLEDGDKVKLVVRFKGRETMFGEHGIDLLNRITADLQDLCVVEKKPEMQGRQQVMVIAPKN
ncbi:translation initiation factor IF-3 [Calditerrivibrio nitroreducens]|uniref:Translation initiation factor IF-3 n=1 Tax=Calditerrivibrio nitroreducens (strain DSM 19672 / NBRC 101217 / Yu37-1) TaxID=768670 RepID=E4TJG4_CALNY|nr:bacterial translation initiation factor 3 (bIF-3) [Calditerrivibrio nitroreducens DSM 19672]